MEYDKTRFGIAYVLGKKERKVNKAKYEKIERELTCCSLQYIQYVLQMNYKKRQKFVHCEILFCYKANLDYAEAYGVYEKDGVMIQKREFKNPAYRFRFLSITSSEFDLIYDFCQKQLNKPFDYQSASWRLLIYPPKCTGKLWWCASFVHAALKKIDMLTNYRINTLDNDELIKLIKNNYRIIQGVNPGNFTNVRI